MTAITPGRMIAEDARAGDPCGPSRKLWISEAGGLTQFGAFVEILPPGSRSSIKHWHSAEDELVYMLEGEVTLVEGDTRTLLRPGDAATFGPACPSAIRWRIGARRRRASSSSAPARRPTPPPIPTSA